MDYSTLTKKKLIELCRQQGIKCYSGKNKSELLELIKTEMHDIKNDKKIMGQFYTTNADYILDGMTIAQNAQHIIEPFAGKGDLIDWVQQRYPDAEIRAHDIEPKRADITQRDTLKDPPDYENSWIITNPPYLARNKSQAKEVYDKYETNDLYKCFILSISTPDRKKCDGGIIIIPAGFFFSPRDIDIHCRDAFMSYYRITKVRYFEEPVFDDTTTTIVAISFEKSRDILREQDVNWEFMPSRTTKTFKMCAQNYWIIGGEIYKLPTLDNVIIRRHVAGQKLRKNEQQTFITLRALDSGAQNGRICLEYKENYVYPAKECSRTYATLRITGKTLSKDGQIQLCQNFNKFIEQKREETHSLFLPQFRESKEYARKRIPFELAYRIVLHVMQ